MKKMMFFIAAAALSIAAQAQTATVASNDLKSLNQQEKTDKKEKKAERKALRKLKGKEVSYMSKQAFYSDFRDVSGAVWVRSDNFDEASFWKNGEKMTAFYDDESKLIGTTSMKHVRDLPAPARQFIGKKYAGYKISQVMFFDDNELNESDMVLFGHQFDDQDNYFVKLSSPTKQIILQVDMEGNVSFFRNL